MRRELYELDLEIQEVRAELENIMKQGDDFIKNELVIKTSQKLDKMIVQYIQMKG